MPRVTKRSEAWAENFAAYMDGGRNKKKVPDEIAEMIEGYFKRSEREFSPRKTLKGDYNVDWEKISSLEYRKKFEKLSDNPKVAEAIEVRAKWALNNRNGLRTEEIYAINLDTGAELARIVNQNVDSGVIRTKGFTKTLNEADKAGTKVLLIHNHPKGLPPSPGDINSLISNRNIAGITVGHNGSVYYYTRPKKMIPEEDFRVALMKYLRYTETTGIEKALEDLSKEYGFEFRKL